MFESVFEFLFKYRPLVFQEGDFTLHATWSVYIFATLAAAAAAAIFTLRTYARVRGRSRRVDRAVLAGLRLAALAVILFCLVRPVLVLTSVVPQQNFLGILIDDSRSMQIADRDGETRSAFVQESFGSPESPLLAALGDRFALRFFRFSSSTERFEQLDDLSFSGTQTHLGSGPRAGAGGARGRAALRSGDDNRRRRQRSDRPGGSAVAAAGECGAGLHGGIGPRRVYAGHSAQPDRDTPLGFEGNLARRGRGDRTDGLSRLDRFAQRGRRGTDRQLGECGAARRWRTGHGADALHRV